MDKNVTADRMEDWVTRAERKAPRQLCPNGAHQMECIFNHDYVGKHGCVPVCTNCQVCRHGMQWTYCGTCGDLQWEDKEEHFKSESQRST